MKQSSIKNQEKLKSLMSRCLVTLALLLIAAVHLAAQQNSFAVASSNPQRSRVANTAGLDNPPREVLWKSEKLFVYQAVTHGSGMSGPYPFSIDLPTGQSISVPIICGNNLFFSYNAVNAYVYVIDRSTGVKPYLLRFDNGRVSPPAAAGDIVFFGVSNGMVYAYDIKARKAKWTFQEKNHSFADTSPMLDGELLYMYASGKGLYALDAETGEVRWFLKASAYIHSPAISGNRIVMTGNERLIAMDRKSGTVEWAVQAGRPLSAPAILDDQVFVTTQGEIRAYSLVDGSLRWKLKNAPDAGTSLALYRGRVYYGGKEHSVIALDAASGAERMRFKTPRPCHAPTIAGGLLYVTCEDNNFYALDPATLVEKWRIDNKKSTPPAAVFADGVMYTLGTDGYLFALR